MTNTALSRSVGSPSQPLETPLAVTLKHQTDKWIIRVVPPRTLLHELYLILIFQQYFIKKYLIIIKRSADVSFLKSHWRTMCWSEIIRWLPSSSAVIIDCPGVSETCLLSS